MPEIDELMGEIQESLRGFKLDSFWWLVTSQALGSALGLQFGSEAFAGTCFAVDAQ